MVIWNQTWRTTCTELVRTQNTSHIIIHPMRDFFEPIPILRIYYIKIDVSWFMRYIYIYAMAFVVHYSRFCFERYY